MKTEKPQVTDSLKKSVVIKSSKDIFLGTGYSANADIVLDRRKGDVAIKERDVLFEKDTIYVEIDRISRTRLVIA